jgi:hypothetical protein
MNKLRFILFALAGVIIGILFFIMKPFKETLPKVTEEKTFSKEHLIAIQVDSFQQLVTSIYGGNAQIKINKNFDIVIGNQGQRLSYFYNNNERLLKVEGQDFSIKNDVNLNTLTASFKIEQKDKQQYVWLPTDVIIGIAQQKNN